MAAQQDWGATKSYAREAYSQDASLNLARDVAQAAFADAIGPGRCPAIRLVE